MEDITPLNLEDSPKLFGLRYDQLICVLGTFILSTQLYSWMEPTQFLGQDLRTMLAIFIFMIGPVYCLVNNGGGGNYEFAINNIFTSQIYIPGPDPNPIRFLTDEQYIDFPE